MMKKILVIDDEPDVRMLLCRRLDASRFLPLEAGGGSSGIALAEREKPDLILLDLMMPGQDGVAVFRALKSNAATKDIPVIFLTALSPYTVFTTDSLDKLGRADPSGSGGGGRYKIIGKPYEPEELIREIRLSLGEGSEGNKAA